MSTDTLLHSNAGHLAFDAAVPTDVSGILFLSPFPDDPVAML